MVGVLFFKQLSMPYRLLLIHTLIAMVVESLGFYLGHILKQNNTWLYNIYTIVDVWLIAMIGIGLSVSKKITKPVFIFLILLSAGWIWLALINGLNELFSIFILSGALMLIVMYIHVLLSKSVFSGKKVITQPVFVLSVSIIVYYVTIIPLFGLLNYLVENDITTAKSLFSINQFANYFRYSLTGLVFYLCARQVKGNTAELSDQ